jgi:hypothetical protein
MPSDWAWHQEQDALAFRTTPIQRLSMSIAATISVHLTQKNLRTFGDFTHSWHIGNRVFARDLAMTIEGAVDRKAIPTRVLANGHLSLIDAPRPPFMEQWGIKSAANP